MIIFEKSFLNREVLDNVLFIKIEMILTSFAGVSASQ